MPSGWHPPAARKGLRRREMEDVRSRAKRQRSNSGEEHPKAGGKQSLEALRAGDKQAAGLPRRNGDGGGRAGLSGLPTYGAGPTRSFAA